MKLSKACSIYGADMGRPGNQSDAKHGAHGWDAVPMPGTERYTARFTPQAWINDYAVEVDAEGPREWDVTDCLVAMTPEDRAAAMRADSYESDELRTMPTAPKWIREWAGPFYVEVLEPE